MIERRIRWVNFTFQIGALLLALLFTVLVLVLAGAPPLETFRQILL